MVHKLPQEDAGSDTDGTSSFAFVLYLFRLVGEEEAFSITTGCDTAASFLLDWIRMMTTDRATSITASFNRWFLHR